MTAKSKHSSTRTAQLNQSADSPSSITHHLSPITHVNGLMTDLYHVDAAYVSWYSGQNGEATFDLYTRSTPFGGSFLLVAGLELALDFVRSFRYSDHDLAYLQNLRPYEPAFLKELRNLRFSGEVLAMPEGTVAFANEPMLRVTAPFREALLLESGLLRAIGVSTLIATKAARLTQAAAGKAIADFGFRRAHDPFLATRSAFIGGCASTSFVAAARDFDIPSTGTIPHALVQAFSTEREAFRAVAQSLSRYTLLLDTYNVRKGIATAIETAIESRAQWNHELVAVRLDSGDLAADSRYVREALDAAGLNAVQVLVSGDLDEFRIKSLLDEGAPIDGFGVGGNLGVGLGSAPSGTLGGTLGAVYKLVWYQGTGDPARIKLAGAKSTWPGKKQVYRIGNYTNDIIQLDGEPPPADGTPLLQLVVRNGEFIGENPPSVSDIRARSIDALQSLPTPYRSIHDAAPYPVQWSNHLQNLRERISKLVQ